MNNSPISHKPKKENNGGALVMLFLTIGMIVLLISSRDSPEEKAVKEAHELEVAAQERADERAKVEWSKKSREAEESIANARIEGAKALEEFDNAIRNDIASRKKALQKAAVKHEHHNGHGQPTTVDLYTMKDGRLILCTTSISSTGAIMNCDGEP